MLRPSHLKERRGQANRRQNCCSRPWHLNNYPALQTWLHVAYAIWQGVVSRGALRVQKCVGRLLQVTKCLLSAAPLSNLRRTRKLCGCQPAGVPGLSITFSRRLWASSGAAKFSAAAKTVKCILKPSSRHRQTCSWESTLRSNLVRIVAMLPKKSR